MSRINLIKAFGSEDAETFNKCSTAYEMGRTDGVYEFIQKFERRTQLRQMSKFECILAMYDIWREMSVSEEENIQEEQNVQ